MTLGDLKKKLAKFTQRDIIDYDVSGGVNLITEALEEARLSAERLYNWRSNRVQAKVVVQPTTGGLLSAAVINGTATAVDIKSVESAWQMVDGERVRPLYIQTAKGAAVREKRVFRQYQYSRAPSDRDIVGLNYAAYSNQLVINGDRVTLTEANTEAVDILMDVQAWMTSYRLASDSATDWMMKYGHDYMFYYALSNLNWFTKDFVSRQEGGIGPPDRMVAQKLAELREWDAFSIEGGRQPGLSF
jgi:hypothetical protein